MSNQTKGTEIPQKAEDEIKYLWRLDKDILTNFRTKKVACSPIFLSGLRGGDTKWQMELRLGNQYAFLGSVPTDNVGIFIKLLSIGNFKPGATDVHVRCKIELGNRHNQPQVVKTYAQNEPQPICVDKLLGCEKFCAFDELVGHFASGGEFYLDFDVTLWVAHYIHTTVTVDQVLAEYVAQRQLKRVTNSMKAMLRDAKSTDMTIGAGSFAFQVHTCILAGQSLVFAAMLDSGMLEATNRQIEISDFDPEIVQAMLKYMYYGDLSAAKKRPFDLLRIADKYELLELKEDCEKFIVPALTVANAGEALKCAHEHNLEEAMPSVIDFINRNRADIGKTGSLTHVAKLYPDLVLQLYLSC